MDQILKNIGKKLLLSLVCFSGAIAVLVWAVEQGKLSPQGFLGAILIVAVGMVVSALVFIATSTKGFTSNGTRSAVDKIGGKRSTVSVRAAKAFLVLLGVVLIAGLFRGGPAFPVVVGAVMNVAMMISLVWWIRRSERDGN